jgi:hypothetical protein
MPLTATERVSVFLTTGACPSARVVPVDLRYQTQTLPTGLPASQGLYGVEPIGTPALV